MNKKSSKFILVACLTLIGTNAFAEDSYKGSWYALPGVSYLNAGSDLNVKDGVGGALRGGKQLDENWDIQFGTSYAKGGKYKQTLLGVDALYVLDRSSLSPFLVAGIGIAQNDLDSVAGVNANKTSWMFNVGAGVQYAFSDRIGLQADVRRVLSEVKNIQDSVGNTYVNLSLIVNFDVPKTVVVEKPVEPPVVVAEPAPSMQKPIEPPVVAVEEKPVVEPVAPVVAEACQPKFEKITISAETLFAFDKANIKTKGRHILNAAAEKLKANADIDMVLVTGHTDKIGSKQYNQKLSELRAGAVKTYLVSKGVDASRLKTNGKGELEPVVACQGVEVKKLIECLQPNRRVVFSAEKQRESACK